MHEGISHHGSHAAGENAASDIIGHAAFAAGSDEMWTQRGGLGQRNHGRGGAADEIVRPASRLGHAFRFDDATGRGEPARNRQAPVGDKKPETRIVSAQKQPESDGRPNAAAKSKRFHGPAVGALSARLHQLHSTAGRQRGNPPRNADEQRIRINSVQSLHV